MANSLDYDPFDDILLPTPHLPHNLHEDIESPITFDSNNSGTSTGGVSAKNSPPQSTESSPNLIIDGFEPYFNDFQTFDLSVRTQPIETLQILAQPRARYRERYCSETDPNKHRAQRFIRADEKTNRYKYPTIRIPVEWCDPNRNLYIRVTLVTIHSEAAPVMCVHPYAIDTQESDVLKDGSSNSLYFPIMNENIHSEQKSFRISQKKMTQQDLRSYGPLHLLDSSKRMIEMIAPSILNRIDQFDIQRTTSSHDAKQIIDMYQLWKSQLVFTIAERFDNSSLPIPKYQTSVTSQTMCDETSERRKDLSINNNSTCTNILDETVICAPTQGNWHGGDGVLMVIPKIDRKKVFHIYFDYESIRIPCGGPIGFVDSKTVFFQTPPCQVLMSEQNIIIPIIVTQNDSIIARVDFLYLTSMKATANLCSHCQLDTAYNNHTSNKRRQLILESLEEDGGELLAEQMSQLTTKEKPLEPNQRLNMNEAGTKFDAYLGQLQEAVVAFVRTGNPSRIFRRTRLLIAKCDENPPPLDDAIRHGQIEIALKLIEQILEMSAPDIALERENDDGETPLLLAAKFNYWNLIEVMLKKRSDLAEKTDKYGNTILHLLASIPDDAASVTIKNVLEILPDGLRTNLLGKENDKKQLAMNVAQDRNHIQCFDLLKTF